MNNKKMFHVKHLAGLLLAVVICFNASCKPCRAFALVAGGATLYEIFMGILAAAGVTALTYEVIEGDRVIRNALQNDFNDYDELAPTAEQKAWTDTVKTATGTELKIYEGGGGSNNPKIPEDGKKELFVGTTKQGNTLRIATDPLTEHEETPSEFPKGILTTDNFGFLSDSLLRSLVQLGILTPSSAVDTDYDNVVVPDLDASEEVYYGYKDFNDVDGVPSGALLMRVWYENGNQVTYYNNGHMVNDGFYYKVDGTGFYGGIYGGEWRTYENYSGPYGDWSMGMGFTMNYSRKGLLSIGSNLVGYLPNSEPEYNIPVVRGILLGGQLFDFSDMVNDTGYSSDKDGVTVQNPLPLNMPMPEWLPSRGILPSIEHLEITFPIVDPNKVDRPTDPLKEGEEGEEPVAPVDPSPYDPPNPIPKPYGDILPIIGSIKLPEGMYPVPSPDDLQPPWRDMGVDSISIADRFPFCVPFDLYRIIQLLDAEPETPRFLWRFPLPNNKYKEITLDLKLFDPIALLVRRIELIVFIVGLLLLTRDIIRG